MRPLPADPDLDYSIIQSSGDPTYQSREGSCSIAYHGIRPEVRCDSNQTSPTAPTDFRFLLRVKLKDRLWNLPPRTIHWPLGLNFPNQKTADGTISIRQTWYEKIDSAIAVDGASFLFKKGGSSLSAPGYVISGNDEYADVSPVSTEAPPSNIELLVTEPRWPAPVEFVRVHAGDAGFAFYAAIFALVPWFLARKLEAHRYGNPVPTERAPEGFPAYLTGSIRERRLTSNDLFAAIQLLIQRGMLTASRNSRGEELLEFSGAPTDELDSFAYAVYKRLERRGPTLTMTELTGAMNYILIDLTRPLQNEIRRRHLQDKYRSSRAMILAAAWLTLSAVLIELWTQPEWYVFVLTGLFVLKLAHHREPSWTRLTPKGRALHLELTRLQTYLAKDGPQRKEEDRPDRVDLMAFAIALGLKNPLKEGFSAHTSAAPPARKNLASGILRRNPVWKTRPIYAPGTQETIRPLTINNRT